ncbi:MAG TPA: sulfotransferase [Herpetosiphonaceae bacterium]
MQPMHAPTRDQRGSGETISQYARIARDYVTSYYRARSERASFQTIATYCMFIGHARSGHSIMGALLDAHPNVILPDEVDALRYVAAGFRREQIFHLLLERSRKQARKGRTKGGRNGKRYSYAVPGQWQGRFSTLKVIGDSKAGKSTQRFASNPALLHRLERCMAGIDVKLIHVIRNPYDNISTLMLRGGRTFENAITQYFQNCSALAAIRSGLDSAKLLTVRQEDLIVQPGNTLRALCAFLGIDAPEEYVQVCAGILYAAVPKSRYSVAWSDASIDLVRRKIEQFDFLAGYAYDDEDVNQACDEIAAAAVTPPGGC